MQFLWYSTEGDKVYCSIDLVPTFKIKKINALELAKICQHGHDSKAA
jgi:hypothetical protein